MNTRLLRKVQKHILAVPERFHMARYCQHMDPDRVEAPPCGTVACIGGWAHILTMKRFPATKSQAEAADTAAYKHARKKLGLTRDESCRLFSDPDLDDYDNSGFGMRGPNQIWPKKFGVAYIKAKTAKQRAKVAVARIDHFIKTRGRE